jgi:hypothetical protein
MKDAIRCGREMHQELLTVIDEERNIMMNGSKMHDPSRWCLISVGSRAGLAEGGDETGGGMPSRKGNKDLQPT